MGVGAGEKVDFHGCRISAEVVAADVVLLFENLHFVLGVEALELGAIVGAATVAVYDDL